jgi:hypothetical protein
LFSLASPRGSAGASRVQVVTYILTHKQATTKLFLAPPEGPVFQIWKESHSSELIVRSQVVIRLPQCRQRR